MTVHREQIVKWERKQTNKMQQLDVYYQQFLNIMMPETCWGSVDNKHLTVASCWFFLSHFTISLVHILASLVSRPWTLSIQGGAKALDTRCLTCDVFDTLYMYLYFQRFKKPPKSGIFDEACFRKQMFLAFPELFPVDFYSPKQKLCWWTQ